MPLTRHRFTVDEFQRMAEAGVFDPDSRLELLDGEIVEMTPIGPPHRTCVNRLTGLFAPLAGSGPVTLSVQADGPPLDLPVPGPWRRRTGLGPRPLRGGAGGSRVETLHCAMLR